MSLEPYAHSIMPRVSLTFKPNLASGFYLCKLRTRVSRGTQTASGAGKTLSNLGTLWPLQVLLSLQERRHGLVTHQKLKPSVPTDRQGEEGVCERCTCGSGARRISTWVGYCECRVTPVFFWLEPLA